MATKAATPECPTKYQELEARLELFGRSAASLELARGLEVKIDNLSAQIKRTATGFDSIVANHVVPLEKTIARLAVFEKFKARMSRLYPELAKRVSWGKLRYEVVNRGVWRDRA